LPYDAGPDSLVDASPADASDASDASLDADVDLDAMSEESLRLLGELGRLVESNQRDCNVLAARLDAFYDEHATFIKTARRTYKNAGHPRQAELRRLYEPRFTATWKRFQPGMKRCKDNTAIKAVIDKALDSD
jgi:hypothetical protein